ncbi:unnamed protein product (macronuclear) [Paramecium tetraurelia]|uniref:PB1 domain-containing protein n=1 Tax=Paramecium tetraurelia TaxID=5888 RepID=A0DGU1_PARTE|nr:uncharacterized protein GSPATT00002387001 [Paramecium tetraurelia]CAK82258.1 unnamed protein product [Paramecium tetraurelia]|eukprot:XP_001449655.1 hypothetical protein (macronuclear) [Paramecium tetraurelia strain d4-2]
MNLKIACQGQEFNFEEVYSFEELKLRLHQTEPSFILESLTYQDEEDDIITLANENDFSCLSTNSNFTVQAQGKFDEEWAIKEFKRNQRLIKRIAKKVKQLKQKQKNNLIQERILLREVKKYSVTIETDSRNRQRHKDYQVIN